MTGYLALRRVPAGGIAASCNACPAAAGDAYGVGLRCLIVDDSTGFLEAARAFLEQEGITVVGVASTGEAAIRRVSELCPDVTLVDIDLCGASGLDLARHLAEACGGQRAP